MRLVPEAFKVPEKLEHPEFVIRKLCASDVYLDYIAVMTSIDIIRKTRGGDWPTTDLSFEDDMIDLAWHQREFEYRTSFAYTVMSPDGSKCLGCLYLFQPGWRNDTSKNADVDVSFWVTQEEYDKGLYPKLYKALDQWLKTTWPFKNIVYTNLEIPK